MKTSVFVLLILLLSFASAFAGAMIFCWVLGAADEIFVMGGIIGFLVPSVCIIAAEHRSRHK